MKRIWLALSILSVGTCLHAVDMKNVVYAPENINEQIDIDEEELYTFLTFKELIQEHEGKNIPYCIVRVKTKKENKEYAHYYDAQSFNDGIGLNAIFLNIGLDRPMNPDHLRLYCKNPINPRNTIPFRRTEVSYFFINSLADTRFTFLCSLTDMSRSTAGKMMFANLLILNSNDNTAQRMGHCLMGEMYFEGDKLPRDFNRAIIHLRRCVNPDQNDTSSFRRLRHIYNASIAYVTDSAESRRNLSEHIASAKLMLGNIYSQGGDGVQKDFDRALYYLTAVAHDAPQSYLVTQAQLLTGLLYSKHEQGDKAVEYFDMVIKGGAAEDRGPLFGSALFEKGKICYSTKKYNEAFDSFSRAIEGNRALPAQERVPMIDESCRVFLSRLYYEGNGIGKDYAKVAQYMMPLKDMPGEIGYEAQLLLGLIYYEGGYGIEKNLDAARGYLTKAANQTAHADLAERAQKKLAELNSQQSKK
jgi:TPR repeat protein